MAHLQRVVSALLMGGAMFMAGCSGEAAEEHPATAAAQDNGVSVKIAKAVRKAMQLEVQRDRHRRSVFNRVGARTGHRRADVGELPRRRGRDGGAGALHAGFPSARRRPPAGAGQPGPRPRAGGERQGAGRTVSGARQPRHRVARAASDERHHRHGARSDGRTPTARRSRTRRCRRSTPRSPLRLPGAPARSSCTRATWFAPTTRRRSS